MNRWAGKTAVITGASVGIGEAISRAFVNAGLTVLGLSRREEKLSALADSLKNSNGSFHYKCCDVRKEQDILDAFAYADKELGGVCVLVNNAGVVSLEPISAGKTSNFQAILEINVLGAAICAREAIKSMRKHKEEGHIFNINSVLGLDTTASKAPVSLYSTSKHALRGMTKSLRLEIVNNHHQIRITEIYPGLVKTDILNNTGMNPDDVFQDGRYLEKEQIADCVMYALGAPPNVQLEEMVITPTHP